MGREVQTLFATVLGAVLLLIGIAGFINDPVLGLFDVSSAQNLVHLLSGAAGIIIGVWTGIAASRWFNRVFGIVFGFVAIFGFAGLLGSLDTNAAGNMLHLVLAAASIGVGFWGKD